MLKVVGGKCYHQHKYFQENSNYKYRQLQEKRNVMKIENSNISNENVEHVGLTEEQITTRIQNRNCTISEQLQTDQAIPEQTKQVNKRK